MHKLVNESKIYINYDKIPRSTTKHQVCSTQVLEKNYGNVLNNQNLYEYLESL